MKLYIDIDGVLIKDSLDEQGQPTAYAKEFLEFATNNFECYWLTTHCMNGENHATEYVSTRIPEALEAILKIKLSRTGFFGQSF